jgi:hypothetical protein
MRERQYQIQDGNLVLNASDFDDSSTISNVPIAPSPVESVKLKSVAAQVGSPSTVNPKMSPPVQPRFLLRYHVS